MPDPSPPADPAVTAALQAADQRIHDEDRQPDRCPDGGRCWHACPTPDGCWRVVNAAPFTGTYPHDSPWPPDLVDAHKATRTRAALGAEAEAAALAWTGGYTPEHPDQADRWNDYATDWALYAHDVATTLDVPPDHPALVDARTAATHDGARWLTVAEANTALHAWAGDQLDQAITGPAALPDRVAQADAARAEFNAAAGLPPATDPVEHAAQARLTGHAHHAWYTTAANEAGRPRPAPLYPDGHDQPPRQPWAPAALPRRTPGASLAALADGIDMPPVTVSGQTFTYPQRDALTAAVPGGLRFEHCQFITPPVLPSSAAAAAHDPAGQLWTWEAGRFLPGAQYAPDPPTAGGLAERLGLAPEALAALSSEDRRQLGQIVTESEDTVDLAEVQRRRAAAGHPPPDDDVAPSWADEWLALLRPFRSCTSWDFVNWNRLVASRLTDMVDAARRRRARLASTWRRRRVARRARATARLADHPW